MDLKHHVTRTLFRGLRVLDVTDMALHAKFLNLRRRYYDLFWINVARETGAAIRKWDYGYHRLDYNGSAIIVRGAEVRFDDHLTLDVMGNKSLTYELMAEQGVSVPRHVRFPVTDMKAAFTLLEDAGRPLVIKPNFGTGGGRGVTTGVTTRTALRRAALWAARFDIDLIAEEQVEGQSWRLLFLDGVLLDAIRRDPPCIMGDGIHSISDLVATANLQRLRGNPFRALSPIRIDRECIDYLAAQDLDRRAIPAAGEAVVLKRAINENDSSQNHSLPDVVHPMTLSTCQRLVNNLGVRLAGIDILARDINVPLARENGVIGEINTTPGLHHHDLIANPSAGPSVAARLVRHMLETQSGTVQLPRHTKAVAQLREATG